MPNQIDGNGIQIETYKEILEAIVEGSASIPGLKQIYGSDINTASNTPDGQMINIYALSKQDILDLIVQDYNSKDPDQAVGVALDAVSQLCGITRKGGTYTEVVVTVTASFGLNLTGLDDSTDPFTVSDGSGNLFYLKESASLITGANNLNFRAAEIGAIQILANTITTIVSTTSGVTAVNNAAVPYQDGTDQETDANMRIRRAKSVALPAKGAIDGLFGGLSQLEDLTEVKIFENVTNSTDADGIPAHSIWVIVDGGDDEDIADVIYKYRSMGCGMRGAETVAVEQVDGSEIDISFDRVIEEELSIYFHAESISNGIIDIEALKTALAAQYTLGIYETADTASINALIREINSDVVPNQLAISSDRITYDDILTPSTKQHKFVVSTANISILTNESSSSSSSSSTSSSSSSSAS